MEETTMRAASEEVSRHFRSLIDANDVDSLKQLQELIDRKGYVEFKPEIKNLVNKFVHNHLLSGKESRLGRLQDSNAVLSHFNEYSEKCYADVASDFTKNTRLLKSMKSDLDHIFMKLRSMKAKLVATYPDTFPDGSTAKMLDQRPDLESPLQ